MTCAADENDLTFRVILFQLKWYFKERKEKWMTEFVSVADENWVGELELKS